MNISQISVEIHSKAAYLCIGVVFCILEWRGGLSGTVPIINIHPLPVIRTAHCWVPTHGHEGVLPQALGYPKFHQKHIFPEFKKNGSASKQRHLAQLLDFLIFQKPKI